MVKWHKVDKIKNIPPSKSMEWVVLDTDDIPYWYARFKNGAEAIRFAYNQYVSGEIRGVKVYKITRRYKRLIWKPAEYNVGVPML